MRKLLSQHRKRISILLVMILVAALLIPSGKAARPRARFIGQNFAQDIISESLNPSDKSSAFDTEPAPEVPAPEVPAPEVPAPEVPTPEVPTPEVPTPEVPAPEVPAPEVGSLNASATMLTSLSNGSNQSIVPAKAGNLVSIQVVLINNGTTTLTNPVFYGIVPPGSVLESVSSGGGSVVYFHGTPSALSVVSSIQPSTGSAEISGATAFSIHYSGRSFSPNNTISIEVSVRLSQNDLAIQKANLSFSYIATDESGANLAVSCGGSPSYSTNAYYIEYLKPQTYDAIAGMPAPTAGLFNAAGTKNLLISSQKPSSDNKTFAGWSTSPTGVGNMYQSGDSVSLSSANGKKGISLFPVFRATVYTVSFNAAGGNAVAPISYEAGKTIDTASVSRSGYQLVGWFKSDGTKWKFDTDTMPAENIVLTAQWLPVVVPQYRVSFLAGEGVVSPAFRDVNVGSVISAPIASLAGSQIKHWLTSANVIWNFETDTMPASDLTLQAVWEDSPNYEFTLTYDPNGGVVTPLTAKYKAGTKIVKPVVSREHYIVDGWKTPSGALWDFEVNVMPKDNLTLTAQWRFDKEGARLAVLFETGAGSMIPATQTLKFGARVITPTSPRKVDYTFTGWRRKGDVNDWDFATTLGEEHFGTPFILVAQWQENSIRPVTVSFNSQGSSDRPASQKILPGGLVEYPFTYYRSGYTLVGWYTGPNMSYTLWDFEKDRVPAEKASFTLYAYWRNDNQTGSNRPDVGLTIPGRTTSTTVKPAPDLGMGRPVEVPEDKLNWAGDLPEPKEKTPSSVIIGQTAPTGNQPPKKEVNPSTGGLETVEPKEKAPAPIVQIIKEKSETLKENIAEFTASASAKELNMLWVALMMGVAAFLLFILGIIRRGRKR